MADAMDLVQQRVEEERQRHIRAARAKTPGVSRVLCIECEAPIPPARRRAKTPGVSRVLCIECEAPIPPARRRAIPGVQLCITCQEIAELKGKHYNGGAV
ncbi:TPA: TraR/DksA family transcriptional regulator [Escherichia coli]|nr:TraR/DksA family transcriptional regulator [Escherichia coli]